MTAPATLYTLRNHVADKPVSLARLAQLLLAKGEIERAHELCAQAVALAPDSGEVCALVAEVFSHNVPAWYFSMVRDVARHKIYEAAFRRVIRPGFRVLDIGSGTGLFAMMAARAGASEVVTCEANPAVAATVSEVVAQNGFAGRVRVVAKRSSDLQIGVDLDAPADMVVFDNLANNMIGAGALSTVEQAVRWLVRPGAPVIPARGTIRICLAEDLEVDRRQMHLIEGFDLSAFNRVAAPSFLISASSKRLQLRGDPADLFHFDFQSGGPFPEARAAVALSASGGPSNGIAQWLRFEVDDEGSYENLPSISANSAFGMMFYPLMRPIATAPNETLTICGSHDRQSIRIWAEHPKVQ